MFKIESNLYRFLSESSKSTTSYDYGYDYMTIAYDYSYDRYNDGGSHVTSSDNK